jgi:hypothetical protein
MKQITIGTQFIRHYSKRKDIETVIDIYTTTNSAGETVKTRYVCSHSFMGQPVIDYDVLLTTILRSQQIEKESTTH